MEEEEERTLCISRRIGDHKLTTKDASRKPSFRLKEKTNSSIKKSDKGNELIEVLSKNEKLLDASKEIAKLLAA